MLVVSSRLAPSIGHRQRAVGVGHRQEVPHCTIRITGHEITRQRLAQQLIHRVVRKGNLLQLRRDPLREIVIAVVLVGFDVAQRVGGGEQSVAIIIHKGRGLVLGVLDRQEVPIAVVGVAGW